MLRARKILLLTASLASGTAALVGCVGAQPPPELLKQAEVAYGPKVFLVDATIGTDPKENTCTRLGTPIGTSSTATVTVTPTDGVLLDGTLAPIDVSQPHNCYVKVVPKTLHADVLEVTNELFQLCVDSGACLNPDPSKASKSQLCEESDRFDTCPVVEVSHTMATTFCQWIGRRLPSAIEHVIMRQGTRGGSPEEIPFYPTGERAEDAKPRTCDAAVIGSIGCKHPRPSNPEDLEGAGGLDVAAGTKGSLLDLTGNVSEWASDLLPTIRGTATGLPWFCSAALPPGPPACPANTTCVYGQYEPPGQAYGVYPVCVAHGSRLRAISGAHGALFGGNFTDDRIDRRRTGVFGRRIEVTPDESPANSYGFRCVGGAEADDGTIVVEDDAPAAVPGP